MTKKVKAASVVIVGGGIAGLSAAWHLAKRGLKEVVVVEADKFLASHSSARNAAIHMPLEESLPAHALAQRSRELIDAHLGTSWVDALGLVLLGRGKSALDEQREWVERTGVLCQPWNRDTLHARVPLLADGPEYDCLAFPLAGVMDVDRMMQFLIRAARSHGARLYTGAPVTDVEIREGCVRGCLLADGHYIQTQHIILACGAWAGDLGARIGCPLQLTPLKRHLAVLDGVPARTRRMPIVWDVDQDVYMRPESGGILASPCDETPNPPELPRPEPEPLEALGRKLSVLAPALADATVRRSWACLRTMAPDRESVVGSDPRVQGLHWNAGLGGRGMTVGPATGEVVALSVLKRSHPLHAALSPRRLL